MKTTQVTENSYQLTQFGFMNCYLVREPDGWTLIDTAIFSTGGVLAAVNGLSGTIRRIVLTHAHLDHVGAVDRLLARLGHDQTELISNERSLPLLRKPPDLSLRQGEAQGKIKGAPQGIRAKPSRLLVEGDSVGSLRCIDTPGHIPGHMSFLDERDGTLFAGDALITTGELNVSSYLSWAFAFPRFVTWNREIATQSAEKLLDYPIERFACGHGPVRSGGIPALRHAIAKVREDLPPSGR